MINVVNHKNLEKEVRSVFTKSKFSRSEKSSNPQKYNNLNKIIPCKVCYVSLMFYTLLDIDIVYLTGPFLRPEIL